MIYSLEVSGVDKYKVSNEICKNHAKGLWQLYLNKKDLDQNTYI